MTFATLQLKGTTVCVIVKLKRWVTGSNIQDFKSFRRLVSNPNKSLAFEFFNLEIVTSFSVII